MQTATKGYNDAGAQTQPWPEDLHQLMNMSRSSGAGNLKRPSVIGP